MDGRCDGVEAVVKKSAERVDVAAVTWHDCTCGGRVGITTDREGPHRIYHRAPACPKFQALAKKFGVELEEYDVYDSRVV